MAASYREMGESFSKPILAGFLAVVALSIGIGAGLVRRAPTTPASTSTPEVVEEAATIEVHVAGWVVASGVVSVGEGSIVADAIEAAGGLRPGAMTESINLAAEVFAGEQVVVPGPSVSGDEGDLGATPSQGGLLSLNHANAEELEQLPGVGPVLAGRIVAFREDNGRFETVEDLLEVPGIGEAKLSSIRDLVRP